MGYPVLPRDFYDREVVTVARDLIGKLLVRRARDGLTVGRILEVEAYLAQGDSACHGARGPTPRNASLFGPPGHAYVYAIHSRHCVNVVTDPPGVASAVLIRAVEPLRGVAIMRRRRGRDDVLDLTRGPGRLCEAFAIDRAVDGVDLTSGRALWIAEDDAARDVCQIVVTPRIGVTSAHDLPLRFAVPGNPYVSGRKIVV